MQRSKKESSKSASNSAIAKDASVATGDEKGTGRRLQDAILLKDSDRKLNLERRVPSVERRADTNPGYRGPVRRYTLDSRMHAKDRRDKE